MKKKRFIYILRNNNYLIFLELNTKTELISKGKDLSKLSKIVFIILEKYNSLSKKKILIFNIKKLYSINNIVKKYLNLLREKTNILKILKVFNTYNEQLYFYIHGDMKKKVISYTLSKKYKTEYNKYYPIHVVALTPSFISITSAKTSFIKNNIINLLYYIYTYTNNYFLIKKIIFEKIFFIQQEKIFLEQYFIGGKKKIKQLINNLYIKSFFTLYNDK